MRKVIIFILFLHFL